MALRLTQLDYDREMAFVALTPEGELAGVARVACDPDHVSGEYATIVRSDLKGRGLGGALMRMLIDYAAADGLAPARGHRPRGEPLDARLRPRPRLRRRDATPTTRRWS